MSINQISLVSIAVLFGCSSFTGENRTIRAKESAQLTKHFAKRAGLNLPVYYPAEKLPALFNTEGIPATFIFNENGDLIKQNTGAEDYSTEEYIRLVGTN